MYEKLKKYAGLIYIALMTVVVVIVLACTNEWNQIGAAMREMKIGWLAAAGGCIFIYLLLRVVTLRFDLQRRGCRISWRDAVMVSGAGQFYSAITPSASGGQPMQVWYLHRRGVPASIGTACVSVKFIGFQTAILMVGGVLWICDREVVARQMSGLRWLIGLGFVVNGGLLLAVLLTVLRSRLLDGFLSWTLRLGAKVRLVKNPQNVQMKLERALEEYRSALVSLFRRPVDAAIVLMLSILQTLSYMMVTACMYHAFGLSGTEDLQILTIQYLLFIAAAFVPLPGAAGAQESGFYLVFRGIFPEADLAAAMLCWRFFSYYVLLIAGFVMMAAGGIRRKESDEER